MNRDHFSILGSCIQGVGDATPGRNQAGTSLTNQLACFCIAAWATLPAELTSRFVDGISVIALVLAKRYFRSPSQSAHCPSTSLALLGVLAWFVSPDAADTGRPEQPHAMVVTVAAEIVRNMTHLLDTADPGDAAWAHDACVAVRAGSLLLLHGRRCLTGEVRLAESWLALANRVLDAACGDVCGGIAHIAHRYGVPLVVLQALCDVLATLAVSPASQQQDGLRVRMLGGGALHLLVCAFVLNTHHLASAEALNTAASRALPPVALTTSNTPKFSIEHAAVKHRSEWLARSVKAQSLVMWQLQHAVCALAEGEGMSPSTRRMQASAVAGVAACMHPFLTGWESRLVELREEWFARQCAATVQLAVSAPLLALRTLESPVLAGLMRHSGAVTALKCALSRCSGAPAVQARLQSFMDQALAHQQAASSTSWDDAVDFAAHVAQAAQAAARSSV